MIDRLIDVEIDCNTSGEKGAVGEQYETGGFCLHLKRDRDLDHVISLPYATLSRVNLCLFVVLGEYLNSVHSGGW